MSRRPRKKRAAPELSARRSLPEWASLAVALVGAALVGTCTWFERAAPTAPQIQPGDNRGDGVLSIRYQVTESEWRGRQPTLCEIVDRYELGESARRATFYLNGRGGRCAAARMTAHAGSSITLAVSAPPEFEHCRREALVCR